MNISPQDKSFIITFSSACVLVLVFFFLGVSAFEPQPEEEFISIPLVEEVPEQDPEELKEQELAQNEPISHQLKNESELQEEAERFFAQQESEEEDPESDADKTEDEAENPFTSEYQKKLEALRKKAAEGPTQLEPEPKSKPESEKSTTTRRTTISYILNSRRAIKIPNPVYTCDAVGKVVINIQVSDNGNVTKTSFNRAASSTANGCLIDQAIKYASRAVFNTSAKDPQLGSITFEFQG